MEIGLFLGKWKLFRSDLKNSALRSSFGFWSLSDWNWDRESIVPIFFLRDRKDRSVFLDKNPSFEGFFYYKYFSEMIFCSWDWISSIERFALIGSRDSFWANFWWTSLTLFISSLFCSCWWTFSIPELKRSPSKKKARSSLRKWELMLSRKAWSHQAPVPRAIPVPV